VVTAVVIAVVTAVVTGAVTALSTVDAVEARRTRSFAVDSVPAGSASASTRHVVTGRTVSAPARLTALDTELT